MATNPSIVWVLLFFIIWLAFLICSLNSTVYTFFFFQHFPTYIIALMVHESWATLWSRKWNVEANIALFHGAHCHRDSSSLHLRELLPGCKVDTWQSTDAVAQHKEWAFNNANWVVGWKVNNEPFRNLWEYKKRSNDLHSNIIHYCIKKTLTTQSIFDFFEEEEKSCCLFDKRLDKVSSWR